MSGSLRTTPLHDEHLRLSGKLVPFAGFAMPIHYSTGIQAEHHAVREAAGLFDVSHMGEFRVTGPEALALIQHVTVNNAARLAIGQAQYSAMCREDGGMLDDLLVYRVDDSEYLVVVNAANRERDLEWILTHRSGLNAEVRDESDETALLALQGPRAEAILAPLVDRDLAGIGYYRCAPAAIAGVPGIVARTGYTGEDGFELYLSATEAVSVWRDLLRAGAVSGLVPVGLGARDSLRLEVGFPLYGNDLDEHHTPLEAGLGWIVKMDKGDFLGAEALAREREQGTSRRLVGIRLAERGFPRPGYPVVSEGQVVGEVTSGTVSPSLGTGIALAYVPMALSHPGTPLHIRVRSRDLAGSVTSLPFFTRGSVRR